MFKRVRATVMAQTAYARMTANQTHSFGDTHTPFSSKSKVAIHKWAFNVCKDYLQTRAQGAKLLDQDMTQLELTKEFPLFRVWFRFAWCMDKGRSALSLLL